MPATPEAQAGSGLVEVDADEAVPVPVVVAVTYDPELVAELVPASTTRQNGTRTPLPTTIAKIELSGPQFPAMPELQGGKEEVVVVADAEVAVDVVPMLMFGTLIVVGMEVSDKLSRRLVEIVVRAEVSDTLPEPPFETEIEIVVGMDVNVTLPKVLVETKVEMGVGTEGSVTLPSTLVESESETVVGIKDSERLVRPPGTEIDV